MAMCAVRRIITELKSLALFRFVRYDKHIIQNIVCNVRLPRDKVCVMRRFQALLYLIAAYPRHKNSERSVSCVDYRHCSITSLHILSIHKKIETSPRKQVIDVQRLYAEKSSLCTYQPSIFPGLIFRPQRSPVVLLVFKSSRIVVTGARNYDDIINGFRDSFSLISDYMHNIQRPVAAEVQA